MASKALNFLLVLIFSDTFASQGRTIKEIHTPSTFNFDASDSGNTGKPKPSFFWSQKCKGVVALLLYAMPF